MTVTPWQPFKHQLQAWRDLLSDTPCSRVITSGTGSGKTECFMVPVLEDLLRIQSQHKKPLTGVHALFLYPLNALINSQKERLNEWTKHFNGDIRFCLLNGNTPNNLSGKDRHLQAQKPQEVLSRKLMREDPAPVLVTNGTMLEYMLVRQADAPIIEKSKGKLRWIVLDEAHTYIGSQAAELALQLRRVLQAFEVDAKDVRFVATSATIAGDKSRDELRKYLAQLAGISEEQVDVIGGQRIVPELPKCPLNAISLESVLQIDPNGEEVKGKQEPDQEVSRSRFDALCQSAIARQIRETLTASGAKPRGITELLHSLSDQALTEQELYRWLDICTSTKPSKNGEAFLKLRAHYFQRMLQGLWCCLDPDCSEKKGTPLEKSWPFGVVYSHNRQQCRCGAKVLELAFCQECNEPHLIGTNARGRLIQWTDKSVDEFSLQDEASDIYSDEVTPRQQASLPEILSAVPNSETGFHKRTMSRDGQLAPIDGEMFTVGHLDGSEQCSACGFKGRGQNNKALRRAYLGAPFYTVNTVPTVLEYCPDIENDKETGIGPNSLPGRGRRLITFTDSRQGTARITIKMQQEAERSRLRGVVVKHLKQCIEQKSSIPEEIEVLTKDFQSMTTDAIKNLIPALTVTMPETAEALKVLVQSRESGAKVTVPQAVSWHELAAAISKDSEIKHSVLTENKRLSDEVFNSSDSAIKLSHLLLMREFARRPKNHNNLETQGLVRIFIPELQAIDTTPEHWQKHSLSLDDWRDFLKIAIDFYVRESLFIDLDRDWAKWIGMHFAPKTLLSPHSKEEEENRVKRWPQVRSGKKIQHKLVNLLRFVTGLDTSSPEGEDVINGWLQAAWTELRERKVLLPHKSDMQHSLSMEEMSFSIFDKAWICPVTNKLLDVTFKGVTPYLPMNPKADGNYLCQTAKVPAVWDIEEDESSYHNRIESVRAQVAASEEIAVLREQNLWTDINDRVIEGGFYYTTAEHSAQQSAPRLQQYEARFKEGKTNVLNCSTTMEMGVDIGGITAVVMNNVPPHPANYLQRAGRAGRSKKSRALSYTLCKGNPHDMQVFSDPSWPFTTPIPAPYVEFSSTKLVQRHVNSLLLSRFLIDEVGPTDKEKISLNLEWFYRADSRSISEHFIDWLHALPERYCRSVQVLVSGTALDSHSPIKLAKSAAEQIKKLQGSWQFEFAYIAGELDSADPEGPYAFKLEKEKSRLCREYLLKELATRAFLPGYGFPTDVTNIDIDNVVDYYRYKNSKKDREDREDNMLHSRGQPSRNLAVAIREYAPGADIVIDGRVHRSAGISLNWQKIHTPDARDDQKFGLFDVRCGSILKSYSKIRPFSGVEYHGRQPDFSIRSWA